MRDRFRLRQHGIPVAWADGPNALAEINHYALIYSQDAPVVIERKEGSRWKRWTP